MIGDFFELCERLTKLEQAVRDLIVHTKATKPSRRCCRKILPRRKKPGILIKP